MCPNRSRKTDRNIKLNINSRELKQENYTKYLGVISDNKLTWKVHIKQINFTLSKGLGWVYKLRHLVPKQSLKSLYSSFTQSHVLYGILNWGCASKTILEPLKHNLRKAVRIIESANYTAHSERIFKRLKIFNFDKLYMLETAKMIFQINNNTSNNFLQDEFMKTKTLHKYNTRQSSSEGFSLPSICTKYKKAFLLLMELNSGTASPQT